MAMLAALYSWLPGRATERGTDVHSGIDAHLSG